MANSSTFSGTPLPTAAASDPSLCRISGYLKNAHGQPLAGHHFVLKYCYVPMGLGTDTLLQQERLPIRADRNGYVEFDLLRGARVTSELPNLLPWVHKELTVPDAVSADLIDFLFPYLVSVAFKDPAAASISVNQRINIEVEGTLSDGETVAIPSAAVILESSNEAVLASWQLTYFTGLSPGTADVTITAINRERVDVNQDRRGNDLVFPSLPAVVLPGVPKSVTVT